jgi:hypothetical protein
LKNGDRGGLIEEINIRLTGFGGAVPSDEFTDLTEHAVRQFQRDFVGTTPTGRVCGNTIFALDKFRDETRADIDRIFPQIKCPCGHCSGYGAGGHSTDAFPRNAMSDREEYPGIHRSLIWMMKAMLFYLKKQQALGFAFNNVSSGYRCHQHNLIKRRTTTNHMGKALDLNFNHCGGRVRDARSIQSIRDEIFIRLLGAQMGWSGVNKMGLESAAQGATTWVHVDVRQYEQRFKHHRFFVTSSALAHGNTLSSLLIQEGRTATLPCSGLLAG